MLSDALFLLILHSLWRWLVLLSLVYAIYRAARGFYKQAAFSKTDNAVRHWTATFAHIQLAIGIVLYIQSPIVRYFWRNFSEAVHQRETVFFGAIHSTLMLLAIVLITIGSARAKRKTGDREKFKTLLLWFSLALLLILIAMPWPFSPLAARPCVRHF